MVTPADFVASRRAMLEAAPGKLTVRQASNGIHIECYEGGWGFYLGPSFDYEDIATLIATTHNDYGALLSVVEAAQRVVAHCWPVPVEALPFANWQALIAALDALTTDQEQAPSSSERETP